MINLANVMAENDFYKNGYTLDYLGFGHMNKEEMLKYLNEGVYTEKR